MITALHGFLGLPSDWDFLGEVRAVNLWEEEIPREGDVLLGYSMGGRLALRALLDGARYRKAVIVSAGIDRTEPSPWAERFKTEPWDELMRAWHAQPLFGGHHLERREEDFDRKALVRALREWSAAVLPPPELERIDIPVLWIAGARDRKYVEIAQRAARRTKHGQLWIAENAGHRVPWEQPEAFAARLREFAAPQ
ncbi:MAG TPA: alpha/beta fold hydrolase [Thermoanaerobaculia bacterium]|jgi:2-succinyl-6-hydroxy-2,4-cyclohexadiene-1-carboxylate synthase|nr:alpha/beta fold hydrolase [Thermoanaerobaculia bacterium]